MSASEPLTKDPRLSDLEKDLARSEEPIRLDRHLVALREAAAESSNQLNHKRLTIIQDLAWALINSSAFLFNH